MKAELALPGNKSVKYWDKAWSLVEGCTPVSEACEHCWLASMAHRFVKNKTAIHEKSGIEVPYHLTTQQGNFSGTVLTRPDRLDIPLKTRKPTVFAVWSDLYHESIPFAFTVENQQCADERIPHLLKVPGKKFLSVEPMLGPVDLKDITYSKTLINVEPGVDLPGTVKINALTGRWDDGEDSDHDEKINAVICGGESGPGARPMHPDWVRSLRDQCQVAGVPFTFKQCGTWAPDCLCKTKRAHSIEPRPMPGRVGCMFKCGTKKSGHLLDGKEYINLPWRTL